MALLQAAVFAKTTEHSALIPTLFPSVRAKNYFMVTPPCIIMMQLVPKASLSILFWN